MFNLFNFFLVVFRVSYFSFSFNFPLFQNTFAWQCLIAFLFENDHDIKKSDLHIDSTFLDLQFLLVSKPRSMRSRLIGKIYFQTLILKINSKETSNKHEVSLDVSLDSSPMRKSEYTVEYRSSRTLWKCKDIQD